MKTLKLILNSIFDNFYAVPYAQGSFSSIVTVNAERKGVWSPQDQIIILYNY